LRDQYFVFITCLKQIQQNTNKYNKNVSGHNKIWGALPPNDPVAKGLCRHKYTSVGQNTFSWWLLEKSFFLQVNSLLFCILITNSIQVLSFLRKSC